MNNRIFLSADGNTKVILCAEALQHIYRFAQTRWWHKEAGGQLFSAGPQHSEIAITRATGPHSSDKRSRYHFMPDPTAATHDRIAQFEQDFHSVALWHTHPESNPSPSSKDREATFQYLDSFQGEMSGFLLLIIGNSGTPYSLALWLATNGPRRQWSRLEEIITV